MSASKFISASEFDRPTAVIKVNRLYKRGDQNPVRAFNVI